MFARLPIIQLSTKRVTARAHTSLEPRDREFESKSSRWCTNFFVLCTKCKKKKYIVGRPRWPVSCVKSESTLQISMKCWYICGSV